MQVLVNAIALGSIYALVALGIGLLFGLLRVINFAHGDFITVGGFALIVPSADAAARLGIGMLPLPLVVVLTALVVICVAGLAELFVFRPLRGADSATVMIASFALSYLLQNLILLEYGSRPKSINMWPELNLPINILGTEISALQLIVIAVTAVLIAGLAAIIRFTPIGLQMRAAAENVRMSRLLGVRANRVTGAAIVLSGLMAAIVALLLTVQTGVLSYQMGVPLMIFGFVATVIGGMGSLVGSALGGFLVGIASVLAQVFLPEELRPFRDTLVFALVIAILMFRPKGLVTSGQRGERV